MTDVAQAIEASPAPPAPKDAVSQGTRPEDVPAKVARARAAQAAWAEKPLRQRAKILMAIKDRVLDRAELIAHTVAAETGKPEIEALLAEVLPTADAVDYWTLSIEELLDATEVELDRMSYPGKEGVIYREPRGVVGLITPWNYPVALPLRTLIPGLLAGNAVVFKPSEIAPRSGKLVCDLFEGLLPEGLLVRLDGAGDVGAALAAADVDLVVFTGSVATGRKVAHACAERVSPCALELGGKDAAIVLADANLDRAACGIVWGALTNAGQNCASIERIYVESSVAPALIERVVAEVKSLRPQIDLGAMTTEAQKETALSHVAAAKAAGAKVLVEGAPEGLMLPPVVVQVESDDSPLMREETFGPIIPIAIVADADEAVRRANASRFGLTASIWTKKIRRAEELAHRLRAGVVTINNHAFTGALPAAPWSGHGESGYGITSSPLALDALTRPRFVLVDRSRKRRELWWYPYTPALRTIALSLAALRSRTTGLLRKIGAFFRLVSSMPGRFSS